MTKAEEAKAWALSRVGCPYIYGGTGQICTTSYREARAAQYPNYAGKIYNNCPILSGKTDSCANCKWCDADTNVGKRAYDCAQLVRWCMNHVGISMVSGANSQWTQTNWESAGEIGSIPKNKLCIVYRYDDDKKRMGHTGIYLGDGYIVHAKGHDYGVVKELLGNPKFTHWGIPAGLYSEVNIYSMTLRKGDSGASVSELQRLLNDHGYSLDADGKLSDKMVETSVGRVIVNGIIPEEVGFVNKVISKKSLRDIIADVIKTVGFARACEFLDGIKNLGYRMAYLAGLSFNLDDIIIPPEKAELIERGNEEVRQITENYNMGFITDNERYNQVIDAWTHVNNDIASILMKEMTEADQGFNAVFMMLDSGARGSKDQIKQLSGIRGLMAKPQKAGAEGAQIIENPILSNFKEGMSVLEYFIASHGARKGLADTAMKTADAGYLTRRLVDVSHDVIITEEDCGTLRGLVCTALKSGEEVISTLYERILGRVSVHTIINPTTNEVIVEAGEEITEAVAQAIEDSPIESVEIRSVLTCESRKGVCMKCYGRNLATSRMVQMGEAVGVIAAQAIGEPGTQLTLRTFHAGGVAANAAANASIVAKSDAKIEFDELRTVPFKGGAKDMAIAGTDCQMVVSRLAEVRFIDVNTGIVLSTVPVPYGSSLYFGNGAEVKKGDIIAKWDPFNAVIVTEFKGKLKFNDVIEGSTFKAETDETTGLTEKIIIESRDKTLVPTCDVIDENGEVISTYNFPVGGHVVVNDGDKVETGTTLVKIPRAVGKAGDITGGLPRVTELFEARNPSNPAVVSEIDGEVTMGRLKRGNREIVVTSKTGEQRKYLVSLSKQILVQEHDAVRAGTPLSDGVITPSDILAIKGPTAVQEYIVNEVQDVYRLQGVKINDKHFEIIVRQMMRKVQIVEPGDTTFLEQEVVDKLDFAEENDRIWGKKYVLDRGDSENVYEGQIISARKLRDENSSLTRRDLRTIKVRDVMPATSTQILQGITRAALQTKCHPRQGGLSRGYEGERHLRTPHPRRYWPPPLGQTARGQQGGARPHAGQQEKRTRLRRRGNCPRGELITLIRATAADRLCGSRRRFQS